MILFPIRLALGVSAAYFLQMASFEDIKQDFAFLDAWDDRYKYLIDLGRNLEPYPEQVRDDAHKVRGCASQVWFFAEHENGALVFYGDSDAHIVKGLIAVLFALYSGKTPREIVDIDPESALAPLDLKDHLTPQRSNGLVSMVKRIRNIAAADGAG
ncbi:MAG: SufE family protein [Parvularculaceae bacterium]